MIAMHEDRNQEGRHAQDSEDGKKNQFYLPFFSSRIQSPSSPPRHPSSCTIQISADQSKTSSFLATSFSSLLLPSSFHRPSFLLSSCLVYSLPSSPLILRFAHRSFLISAFLV
eukprot:GHVT01094957.1.p1 GENE.GHVT01094957.1~~GHVT01094957.1.p1  ORF type:complete len:113 (+),score=21.89 GHVT01094957.1:203-541(+)